MRNQQVTRRGHRSGPRAALCLALLTLLVGLGLEVAAGHWPPGPGSNLPAQRSDLAASAAGGPVHVIAKAAAKVLVSRVSRLF